MAVSLTKIVNGKPAVSDTLPNKQTMKCSRCEQTCRLGYSDGEWHRLSTWLNHRRDKHGLPTIELEW